MSRIFQSQNQFIIRFPEHIAKMLQQCFQSNDQAEMPAIQLDLDHDRKDINQRIALKVGINGQSYKATVMQLPTISSTFKTIDRINYFKANDVSELIVVHGDEEECQNIYNHMAQKVMDKQEKKVYKYKCESGLTNPTKYIRQQNFKEKPDIDKGKVAQVDIQMEKIRFNNSQVKQREKQQAKEKKEKMQTK